MGLDYFWSFKNVSLVGDGHSMSHLNDVRGLKDERCTNVVHVEEAWGACLEEDRITSKATKGDGQTQTKTTKDELLERFNYVSNMKRMQCHGRKCELLNDVG